MRTLIGIISIICAILAQSPAHAAKRVRAAEVGKERLVLMPLRLNETEKHMQGAIETALVQGLQQKYEVFAGESVEKKVVEVFRKESLKKDCDETRCLQDISIAFNAELIATASVTKIEGGYLLALSIRNVATNKAEYSNSVACESCNVFQVVNKLKELGGGGAPAMGAASDLSAPSTNLTSNTSDPEVVLWNEAQKGGSADDYQVYLDSYPKGKFVAFAKARIKKLKDDAAAAAEQQQQLAWDIALQENTEAGYERYLKNFPKGRFAGFAKVRLDKIKSDVAAKDEIALWGKAESGNDVADIRAYLNQYPRGRYVAAANVMLKHIKEEDAKGPVMVRIPGKKFELGKYEVTQAEWKKVMGNNPSKFVSCGDTCPVEQVSWDDVQEYLGKLNAKTGKQYRLPTEEEWEHACYAGNQTTYCGSNDINEVAWCDGNSKSATHPAGQKSANAYGLYDMSGNVWEWLSDCNKDNCKEHILRGGSWSNTNSNTRAANREKNSSKKRENKFGFRLARTLP